MLLQAVAEADLDSRNFVADSDADDEIEDGDRDELPVCDRPMFPPFNDGNIYSHTTKGAAACKPEPATFDYAHAYVSNNKTKRIADSECHKIAVSEGVITLRLPKKGNYNCRICDDGETFVVHFSPITHSTTLASAKQ